MNLAKAESGSDLAVTSQIVTHKNFDRPPVVQTSKRGRLPKSVPNLWRYGFDKKNAARRETAAQTRARELQQMLVEEERFVDHLRYQLTVAVQQSNTGRG